MSSYESEYTLFLREMMTRNPGWAEAQRKGRALLWDKKVDFAELRRLAEANVNPVACRYEADGGR